MRQWKEYTIKGFKGTLPQIAKEFNVDYHSLRRYYTDKQLTLEDALEAAGKKRKSASDQVGTTIRNFKILEYQHDYQGMGRTYFFVECLLCGNKVWRRMDTVLNEDVVSCGCYNQEVNYIKSLDLAGKRSGKLVAIEKLDRNKRGQVMWKCKCDCGNFTEVEATKFFRVHSCGCLKGLNLKEDREKYKEKYGVDKTAIDKVRRAYEGPLFKHNTSGVRGVSWDKNRKKWIASIRFNGITYNLGRFNKIEDAEKARKDAESLTFEKFLVEYGDNHKKIITYKKEYEGKTIGGVLIREAFYKRAVSGKRDERWFRGICPICGEEYTSRIASLISDKRYDCGKHTRNKLDQLNQKKIEELNKKYRGKNFNGLEILNIYRNGSVVACDAKCNCGKIFSPVFNAVKVGDTTSCGHDREKILKKGHELTKISAKEGTSVIALKKRSEVNKNNTSGYTGVSYVKRHGRYRAYITFKRKQYHLGFFDNAEDAHKAYLKAKEKIHGGFLEYYKEVYPDEWEKIKDKL